MYVAENLNFTEGKIPRFGAVWKEKGKIICIISYE
jgi:hypothetical protein